MKSPLIVLSISSREFSEYILWSDMYRGLHRAGIIPVSIDTSVKSVPSRQIISAADGLILGGGGDVAPLLYGGDVRDSTLKGVSPRRDANEERLVRHALRRKIPILGICRGAQLINVVRGGKLVQDVNRDTETELNHQGPEEELDSARHNVEVAPDSLLSHLLGGISSAAVNSAHHQAIDTIGRGLRVSATSEDGIVEAIESTEPNELLLGVQWHPENLWKTQQHARDLLNNFSSLCLQSSQLRVAQ